MDWFADNAAALAGLGGLATVIAAIVAVATLMRAGLDSASRTRPYVVVEYRVPEFAYKRMVLVVRNAGPTAARDVEVAFDPPFLEHIDRGRLASYVARRYAQPLSVLGPGQELTSILQADLDDEASSDIPETLTVTVRYKAPWWRRDYRDTFVLQRVIYAEQVFSESSNSVRGRLKAIAASLGKIEGHQSKWGSSLSAVANSIDEASLLMSDPLPGVHWRIRHLRGDRFILENVGDQTALDVAILKAVPDMVEPDLGDGPLDLAPRSGIKFYASGPGTPRIQVAWSGERGSSERHTWEG